MKDNVKLVKSMYPCQDVPVVAFDSRCPRPYLYCELCQRDFPEEDIIASGIDNVLKELN